MSKVEFSYEGNVIAILCKENEKMEEICKKYAMKSLIDINNIYFFYSGKKLNLQLTFYQASNSFDKQRKIMSILVLDKNNTISQNPNSSIIKSPFPICSECKENAILELNDYKIKLSECKNKHLINLLISEYEINRSIDLSKIECSICKNTKYKTFENTMYICKNCKIILCPLCKNNHNQNHNVINYDLKNSLCLNHNDLYIGYCQSCSINICLKCQKEHKKHDILFFGEILPDKDELLKKLNDFKQEKDKLIDDINDMINKLMDFKENLETLYKIYFDMVDKYEDKFNIIYLINTFYIFYYTKIINII